LAHQRQALANWQSVNNKPWFASQIERFAMIAAATGQGTRAARLFGAAAALREAFGTSQQANDRALNERSIARAREHASEPAFSAAWDEGGRMSLEAALQYALGEEEPQPPRRGTGRTHHDKVARTTTQWEERA
jgi:hypothetical protein